MTVIALHDDPPHCTARLIPPAAPHVFPCLSAPVEIYIRKNPTVWVRAGTLGGYAAAVGRFPDATHKLGMKMPGRGMQTIFKNGWNRGARVTLFPHYPAGDSVATLKFVATVLSNGVNSVSPIWMRTYYAQNVNGGCKRPPRPSPNPPCQPTHLLRPQRCPLYIPRQQRIGNLDRLAHLLAPRSIQMATLCLGAPRFSRPPPRFSRRRGCSGGSVREASPRSTGTPFATRSREQTSTKG